VHIEGTDYTIVGIAPPGLLRHHGGRVARFLDSALDGKRNLAGLERPRHKWFQSLYLIARLKPGVTAGDANTNLVFKQYLRSEYLGQSPSQKDLPTLPMRRSS
jgi:hypothetical protein